MATIDAQFQIEMQETTRSRIHFGVSLPKMHLCSEPISAASIFYAMLFLQWSENWRAYFIAVCLPPICALFIHIHTLNQRHKENPNIKKSCAQYDFAPFAVGFCLMSCNDKKRNRLSTIPSSPLSLCFVREMM